MDLVKTHPQPHLHYEANHILQEDELVAVHRKYAGLDKQPLVGFAIFLMIEKLLNMGMI